MAMDIPNRKRSAAALKATQRVQRPRINKRPSESSAIVAVHARNGMIDAGRKEFTSPVYFSKLPKFPQPPYLPQRPKRSATADKNGVARARRTYRITSHSPETVRATFASWSAAVSEAAAWELSSLPANDIGSSRLG